MTSRSWQRSFVPLKFQISHKTLFAINLPLIVRKVELSDCPPVVSSLTPPSEPIDSCCLGYLIRSLPVEKRQPILQSRSGYFCYVPSQYDRYYIELRGGFASYKQKFNSKTRSTINRKIRKFAERCGGTIQWRVFKTKDEMPQFHTLARLVSSKTYQERMHDAGLPDSQEFLRAMMESAGRNEVRGYILFDQNKPVAYLYCPARHGVLLYEYLGYDPDYGDWSVGTILQWHVIEDLFAEACFEIFDFTDGQSDHKRQFATNSLGCADVYFLRKNLKSWILIQSHRLINCISEGLGELLESFGLKSKVRALIKTGRIIPRFGARKIESTIRACL